MKNYRNLSSVIRQVVTEAHTNKHLPFTPDKKSSKKPSFKKPAGQGDAAGMERARALAREAMRKHMEESFGLDISEEEADDLLNSIQEALADLPRTVPGAYNPRSAKEFLHNIKPEHQHTYKELLRQNKFSGSCPDNAAHIKYAAERGHLTTGNVNPKHDIPGRVEESRWVDEYHFKAADHKDAAAKHKDAADGHLNDAQEHQRAGRDLEFHASMRAHHDSMERSYLVAAKPLFRGTGPA